MFGWLFSKRQENEFGAPRSGKWPRVRREHLELQPDCQACGRTKDIEVHHIEPFHSNPSLELAESNFISLCSDPCHFVHGHLMSWSRFNPKVAEDCARYRRKLEESK